jgi:hypothetical protein
MFDSILYLIHSFIHQFLKMKLIKGQMTGKWVLAPLIKAGDMSMTISSIQKGFP